MLALLLFFLVTVLVLIGTSYPRALAGLPLSAGVKQAALANRPLVLLAAAAAPPLLIAAVAISGHTLRAVVTMALCYGGIAAAMMFRLALHALRAWQEDQVAGNLPPLPARPARGSQAGRSPYAPSSTWQPAFPVPRTTGRGRDNGHFDRVIRRIRNLLLLALVASYVLARFGQATALGDDIPTAFLLPITGVVALLGAVVLVEVVRRIRRSRGATRLVGFKITADQIADAHGWTVSRPGDPRLAARWPAAPLYGAESSRIRDLLTIHGEAAGHRVWISHQYGEAPALLERARTGYQHTVFGLVLPESIVGRIAVRGREDARPTQLLGSGMTLEWEDFNRAFHVEFGDHRYGMAVLNPRLMQHVAGTPPDAAQLILADDGAFIVLHGQMQPWRIEESMVCLTGIPNLLAWPVLAALS